MGKFQAENLGLGTMLDTLSGPARFALTHWRGPPWFVARKETAARAVLPLRQHDRRDRPLALCRHAGHD